MILIIIWKIMVMLMKRKMFLTPESYRPPFGEVFGTIFERQGRCGSQTKVRGQTSQGDCTV